MNFVRNCDPSKGICPGVALPPFGVLAPSSSNMSAAMRRAQVVRRGGTSQCNTGGGTGAQGPAGRDGADGRDGFDGLNGPTGFTGPTGDTGFTGPTGATGTQNLQQVLFVGNQSTLPIQLVDGSNSTFYRVSGIESTQTFTVNTPATNIQELRASTLDSIASGILSIGSNVLTTGLDLNNKVVSNFTLGINQFFNLSLNTIAASSNDQIGYQENITPVLLTPTIGVVYTNLLQFTLADQQPAGVYIYELSIALVTNNANSQVSISKLGSTTPDHSCEFTLYKSTYLPTFDRMVATLSNATAVDMWVVGISSPPADIFSINMLRTRIA